MADEKLDDIINDDSPDTPNDNDLASRFLRSSRRFAMGQMHHRMVIAPSHRCMGLAAIQDAVDAAQDAPGATISAIAQRMHASLPAASRMVRDMEGEGLLERVVDPNDRRNSRVKLSPAGDALNRMGKDRIQEYMDIMAQSMGEARVTAFLDELDAFTAASREACGIMMERHPELDKRKDSGHCHGHGHGHGHGDKRCEGPHGGLRGMGRIHKG